MRAASLLFVLAGCTPTETADHAVVGGVVLAVRVEVDAGNVTVNAGGTAIHVGRTLRGAASLTTSQRVVDGILRIEARCETLFPCAADIVLTVPSGIPVDVRTGEGDVRVVGLDSDLSIEVGDGNVVGEGLLGATVRVQAGWGDASLAFLVRPVEVSVGVGVGDVKLAVPEGAYDLDVETLGGQTLDGVAQDANGPLLRVRTASGRAIIGRG
ncbi:MAG: hypothetical protein Q8P18_13295 [Pseudomonadota bacterium]|nr:hypothetical protein [Pseudomonadota bacterium]